MYMSLLSYNEEETEVAWRSSRVRGNKTRNVMHDS